MRQPFKKNASSRSFLKVAEQSELVMDDEEVPFSKQIDDEAVDPAFGDPTVDYV